MHANKEFFIPNQPSKRGKEPQVSDRSMELCGDWKASTSATTCQDKEPTSNIKSFLQSCLKLIRDENAQLEVQRLIEYCDPANIPATTERAVNQIKRYVHTGREM